MFLIIKRGNQQGMGSVENSYLRHERCGRFVSEAGSQAGAYKKKRATTRFAPTIIKTTRQQVCYWPLRPLSVPRSTFPVLRSKSWDAASLAYVGNVRVSYVAHRLYLGGDEDASANTAQSESQKTSWSCTTCSMELTLSLSKPGK